MKSCHLLKLLMFAFVCAAAVFPSQAQTRTQQIGNGLRAVPPNDAAKTGTTLRRRQIDYGATARLFYETRIKDHLEIGLRFGNPSIDEKYKWTPEAKWGFIGTIAELDADKSSFPYNLVVSYDFNDWIGASFVWDKIAAVAHTNTEDEHNDGEFVSRGPSLSLVLTCPYFTKWNVFPYAEIGFNHQSAEFSSYKWWHLGYLSPSDYIAAGCPEEKYGGKARYINCEADPSYGFVYGIGLKYRFLEHWMLDVAYRHVSATAKGHYYNQFDSGAHVDLGVYDVPLSYSVFCFGVRYTF